MKKPFIKIIFIIFIFTILVSLSTKISLAAKLIEFKPQVPIPGFSSQLNSDDYNADIISGDMLGRYIKAVYKYSIPVASILAVIVLMVGGVLWLVSAGNSQRIEQAKKIIMSSLVGLILVFSSWLILNMINPELLELSNLSIAHIDDIPSLQSCKRIGGECFRDVSDDDDVGITNGIFRGCPVNYIWIPHGICADKVIMTNDTIEEIIKQICCQHDPKSYAEIINTLPKLPE